MIFTGGLAVINCICTQNKYRL
ncbi:unnamed protein product [Acanthoscelides obtectus]|uniref:Uncharacterized protein n=1 Tax=Acanthoscelides obtectus TaxID=200917 RepID=A0A9P0PIU8_ACAOB|nr:unnamed protein product [Acanthoscelides obtectus]CAK1652934.1 hypothetical protein AOBTE_LOCUS17975 [Acanthoscelides obtectus]